MAETIEQYKAKLLGFVSARDPLTVLREVPEAIGQSMHGRSAEELNRRPRPDKWSVTEIVAHLSETELAASWRFRQILEHSGSAVIAYDQNLWEKWGDYARRDPHESLTQFRLLRQRNLEMLARLAPEEWERFGVHAERGKESMRDLVKMTAGHDLNHLEQIQRALGVPA